MEEKLNKSKDANPENQPTGKAAKLSDGFFKKFSALKARDKVNIFLIAGGGLLLLVLVLQTGGSGKKPRPPLPIKETAAAQTGVGVAGDVPDLVVGVGVPGRGGGHGHRGPRS